VTPNVPAADYHIYKYGRTSDGMVALSYTDAILTVGEVMATPREMGWAMDAPAGLLTPTRSEHATIDIDDRIEDDEIEINAFLKDVDDPFFGETSLAMTLYRASCDAYDPDDPLFVGNSEILGADAVNISRAASYSQDWNAFFAIATVEADESGDVIDAFGEFLPAAFGLSLSMNDIFYTLWNGLTHTDSLNGAKGIFIPYIDSEDEQEDARRFNIVSLARYMWLRTQRLPFLLNPWDCCGFIRQAGWDDSPLFDPFDFMYWYGGCGFRASDYNEDINNRIETAVSLGFDFISDPLMQSSLIFR